MPALALQGPSRVHAFPFLVAQTQNGRKMVQYFVVFHPSGITQINDGGPATPQDVSEIVGRFASQDIGDQHLLRRVQLLGKARHGSRRLQVNPEEYSG